MKSTSERYGSVAICIHWISAILIFALMASGFRAGMMEESAAKAALLRVHLPIGLMVFALTLARVLWWKFADRKPAPVEGSLALQEMASRVVHVLFYFVIFMMALSGMAMSGAADVLVGGAQVPLPDFSDYAPRIPHGAGARLMIALLVLHIGAALYHHFIQKDGLIARMWFGR